MPWPLHLWEWPSAHCVGGGWAPGPVRTGVENSPLPGFDPREVQPTVSHYTDYAILAHNQGKFLKMFSDTRVSVIWWKNGSTSQWSYRTHNLLQILFLFFFPQQPNKWPAVPLKIDTLPGNTGKYFRVLTCISKNVHCIYFYCWAHCHKRHYYPLPKLEYQGPAKRHKLFSEALTSQN